MSKAKLFLIAGIIGIIVSLSGLIYILISLYNSMVVVNPNSNSPRPSEALAKEATPVPTRGPNDPFSVLLLGYAGGTHDGGRLTDSIMLSTIDPQKQTTTIISIPRDLWLPLTLDYGTTRYSKINSALIEGPTVAKNAVSLVTGITPDYYFAIDFSGFTKAIDYLGGVQIFVDRSFEDPLYPLELKTVDNCGRTPEDIIAISATMSGTKLDEMFPCRYETLKFTKGLQTMDGVTALKYARSRHSPTDGGDYNRARRQRILVEAVKKKVISINFIPKIIPLLQLLSSHVKTDLDFTTLRSYLLKATDYATYPVTGIALTDQNVLQNAKSSDGQYILIPTTGATDWSSIYLFLTPTPTL